MTPFTFKYSRGIGASFGAGFKTPPKPKKKKLPVVSAPPAPMAAPAPNPTPDPRDSQYFSERANDEFNAQNQLSQLDEQAKNDAADRKQALDLLREQLPRQQNAAKNSANKAGLFYSTTLGNDLGDIQTQNLRNTQRVNEEYDRRARAQAAARQAIQQGLSLQDAALMAQAVDRQTQRDQDAANTQALAYEPTGQNPTTGQVKTSRPSYLPPGYENWSKQMKSRYWARRRRGRG